MEKRSMSSSSEIWMNCFYGPIKNLLSVLWPEKRWRAEKFNSTLSCLLIYSKVNAFVSLVGESHALGIGFPCIKPFPYWQPRHGFDSWPFFSSSIPTSTSTASCGEWRESKVGFVTPRSSRNTREGGHAIPHHNTPWLKSLSLSLSWYSTPQNILWLNLSHSLFLIHFPCEHVWYHAWSNSSHTLSSESLRRAFEGIRAW